MALSKLGDYAFRKISENLSATDALLVEECAVGEIFPKIIVTTELIHLDKIQDSGTAGNKDYYLENGAGSGWGNECRLRIVIKNTSKQKAIIKGIGIDKEIVSIEPKSSVKFPNAGAETCGWLESGEVCFEHWDGSDLFCRSRNRKAQYLHSQSPKNHRWPGR